MRGMPVNETPADQSSAPPPPPWYRRHMRRIAVAFIAAGVLIVLAQWMLLPWLLHNRIAAALDAAGVRNPRFHVARATLWGSRLNDVTAGENSGVKLGRVDLDYTLGDLRQGRLKAIRIANATLDLHIGDDGRIDLTPLRSLLRSSPTTRKATPASITLPVDRIELAASKLVLHTPNEALEVPIGGSVAQQSNGRISIGLQLDQERIFVVGGTIEGSKLTLAGAADPGRTLLIVRSIWPSAEVSIDGKLKVGGELDWGGPSLAGSAQVAIASDAAATSPSVSKDKLHLSSGVFHVATDFAHKTPWRFAIADAGLAMADQGFSAEGVAGDVAFVSLSPLLTPPDQKLGAKKLTIGELELTNGMIEFAMTASDTMHVQHTQWTCFTGRVWADDVVVSGTKPISVTLHVQDVELRDMLNEFAKDTASGKGKLSGQIPLVIDGSNVKFGDGTFAAFQQGEIQIKDAETLEATAAAAASSASGAASGQIKKNIVEALKDFQYDKLSARLANEPEHGGLVGHVRMSGHGKQGAKQALAYDLNVTGLDDALRAYLGIRSAMQLPANRPTATRPAATTRKADSK